MAALGLLVVCLLLLAPGLSAQSRAAFGPGGELVQVDAGAYAELIGDSPELSERAVVSLAISTSEGRETLLVPGTEDENVETPLALAVDPTTGAAHVLYARHDNNAIRSFVLVGRVDGEWTSALEVSGAPGVMKGWPWVTTTRDELSDGTPRTVIHLLWWEPSEAGEKILYTPLIIQNGRFLGWNPVLELQSFGPEAPEGSKSGIGALFRAPSLEAGTRGHTTVAAVPQRQFDRLVTMRIRLLPSLLTDLASDVRGHITLVGATGGGGGVLNLAAQVRGHITLVGARIHDGVLDYITDQSVMEVLSHGPEYSSSELAEIGRDVERRIIDSGASIIDSETVSEDAHCSLYALGNAGYNPGAALHQLEVCALSVREAPDIEGGVAPKIYVSEDASQSLVAWQTEDGALRYRRSIEDGWGPTAEATRDDLSLNAALSLLREAVRP